jgi:hypothetical protein
MKNPINLSFSLVETGVLREKPLQAKLRADYFYTITNLDSVTDITSTLHSLLSLLIKALALPSIRLYLSKASQASLLGLNYFCILLSSFN